MEEYVNEDTIVKSEMYDAFKDDITCSLCGKLMIYPVQCSNCQNIYCKNCIENWKQKGGKCPMCKDSTFKDVIEKNNHIKKFKFICIKGCGAKIPFSEINKHYSEDCLLKKEKEKKICEKIKKIKSAITLTPEEIDKYKKKTGKDIPHVESKILFIIFF